MRFLPLLSLAVLMPGAATGQDQSPKPAFEVSSVKVLAEPQSRGTTGMPPPQTDPGLVNYPDVSLAGVLARAYNVKPLQIEGPEWLRYNRFSIVAKVPKDAPKEQIPAMLRNLLAERFGVVVHWQNKEEPGYAMVVASSGAKLTASTIPDEEAPRRRSSGMSTKGHLTWKASTLDDVATSLTTLLGRPVADKTGLLGFFDIVLDAAPDSMPGIMSSGRTAAVESPNPSIFDAVKTLGLILQPGKVTVLRLVVDSANKTPTEN